LRPTALLAAISISVSLAIAEVALRVFTPFPVGYSSHKLPDADLGYRLARDFAEADAQGFRNAPGTGADVLAIGDSHTYGNNVAVDATWPAVLQRLSGRPVYNAGIGSYGLLAYHAILKARRRSETRSVIIGLYPGNDFAPIASNCMILEEPSAFWQQERTALGLSWPKLGKDCADLEGQRLSPGEWVEAHSAIAGALGAVIRGPRRMPDDEPLYHFPDGVPPYPAARIEQHAKSMDEGDPVVTAMLANLERMAPPWAQLRDAGVQVGVLILPARERVVYGHFEKAGRVHELDETFVAQMANQIALEQKCAGILAHAGVPYRLALDDVVTAFDAALQAGRRFYPDDEDGHPYEEGYAAYAQAARALLSAMDSR
jgi:hypothetical protein